jgi:hypothetical protein
MVSNSNLLDSRYGKRRRANLDRRLAIVAGSALLVGGLVWIGTVVFFAPPKVSAQVVGFSYQDGQATVKFEVTKPAARTATCLVGAQNVASMNVGSKQVDVPAGTASKQLEVQFLTTETATSGVVDICRLN